MQIVILEYEGTFPLLMHNPAGMGSTQPGLSAKTAIPTREAEALAGLYLTDDGLFLRFPAQGCKASLVTGGGGRKFGKLSATTVVKRGVFPAEEWALLYDPETRKPLTKTDYVIDTRRAVIKSGMKSSGVQRSRPKILKWGCRVPFEVDDTIANFEVLEEIANLAGRTVGLGDFRPEKGGPFGRYTAKLVKANGNGDAHDDGKKGKKK